MLNNNSFQKDPGSKILLLAAICLLTLTATARGAGCSAVDFSVTFKSVLHTNPLGNSGDGIAEADFNRDGNLDMAVTNGEVSTVNIYLGDGKGGFTVSTLTSAANPRNIFARDFNRDGRMDLLVFSQSNSVTIFNGNGNGGFTLGGTISTGGSAISVADFNLDGIEDFVLQGNFNVEMYLGNGNGTFASPILTPQTNSVATAIAADFNRDGKPDLVLGAFSNAQVFFLPGNGAGGFGAIVSFNVTFSDNRFLTAEDLNGDGRLDLIVGGNSVNARILLGAATGVFTVSNLVNAASAIKDIQTADYNDDGKVDLLVFRDAAMEVRPGNGDGTFAAAALTTATGAENAVRLTAADFNNDGKIDFAATDVNEVFVGLNRCGGLTQKPDVDFTGDGRADIAFFRPSSGSWFILRSEDYSFFSFPFGLNGDIPVAADYDGDGKSDVAVFRPSAATWFISRSGDGGTTFVQFGVSTDTPAPSDYDGDGKADIAIFRPSVGEWWILRSSDGSVFAAQFGANGDIPIR